MRTEEDWHEHRIFTLVAWVVSAVAFGVWQDSAAAGFWWFFGVGVVSVIRDPRSKQQWMDDDA